MTREQATDLVEDLIQAHHDYETNVVSHRRAYRDYLEIKERVIAALVHTENDA
jgi:hypothetical protein